MGLEDVDFHAKIFEVHEYEESSKKFIENVCYVMHGFQIFFIKMNLALNPIFHYLFEIPPYFM